MKIDALRASIDAALQHESTLTRLPAVLAGRAERLHRSIQLPQQDPAGALLEFVRAYVTEVPQLLQAADAVAVAAGLEPHIKPLLRLAQEFFLTPPAELEGHKGLEALLDEAYLVHRMVEEVNDRYMAHFGRPLIPLDCTQANLVAHELVGDELACQLDQVVLRLCDERLDAAIFAVETAQQYRDQLLASAPAWECWPCLSSRLGVGLVLPE